MPLMGFGRWVRNLFSSAGVDDEAAEREDYGTRDRGLAELERDRAAGFAQSEAAQAAQDELDEFRPPRDPAP
jgi:hypothetical protein